MGKRIFAFLVVVFGLTAFAGAVPPLSFNVEATGTAADGALATWTAGAGSYSFNAPFGVGDGTAAGTWFDDGSWVYSVVLDGDELFFADGNDSFLQEDGTISGSFGDYASFQVPEPATMTAISLLVPTLRRRR